MLHILRRQAQSKVIQFMVLLIAIVFIFWGVGSNYINSRNAAATINDEEISFQDFQRAYDRSVEGYREQFGGSVPDGFFEKIHLKQQVLSQLIRGTLLSQGGTAMGLNISRQTTGEEIGTITAFQEQGHFDLNRYRKVLAQNHLTPAVFEAGLRNDILRGMTLAAIDRFPVVTEDELARHLALAEEKMTFVTCSLATERFRDRVQPTREELVRFL